MRRFSFERTIPRTAVRITSIDGDPDVRLWALVTVRNNTTQQVTAIWPN